MQAFHFAMAAIAAIAVSSLSALAQTAPQTPGQPAISQWWPEGKPFDSGRAHTFTNAHGQARVISLAVDSPTNNLFFAPLGGNGRACVTCHQPADSMSLSVKTIQERWQATQGTDPLFDVSDGANCPDKPRGIAASHSLLIQRGLFRIARDWPGKDILGNAIKPEFQIEVVRDPTGCNSSAQYGLKSRAPKISVFRRPRAAANLAFIEAIGFPYDPKSGMPLTRDPRTGKYVSEALMADSRALTLSDQAQDALQTHMQFLGEVPTALLEPLLKLERSLFVAQSHDRWGKPLTEAGANGGPEFMAKQPPGTLQFSRAPIWNEFFAWKNAEHVEPEVQSFRRSVARGAELFSKRQFLVKDSAGVNDTLFGNPVRNTCAMCHNMMNVGVDVAPGRVDVGNVNPAFSRIDPDLPLFRITCHKDAKPHAFLGRDFLTHDPGYALSTGRCADVGKIVTQQMRGLAARAPYFANGSVNTLREIVEMYDRRYNIRFSEQETVDLTNLLSVL